MAVVGINYNDGGKPTINYESVTISYDMMSKNPKEKIFNTGDFCKDWFDCNHFIIFSDEVEPQISNSSSVDHFIMDGAPYESAYLKCVDEIWELYYVDKNDPNWVYSDIFKQSIEYFVPEGTKPTWAEMKSMYKEKI